MKMSIKDLYEKYNVDNKSKDVEDLVKALLMGFKDKDYDKQLDFLEGKCSKKTKLMFIDFTETD